MVTERESGPIGGTPFGRYTLLRPIGRGGMAQVWKAKIHGAQNFQRLVVIKRILPHLSSDPAFVRMFTTEAMLSARLSHPNIVQVFEFSEVDGEHFLAMEYVHGVNLGDVLKGIGEGGLPIGMAVHIAREVSLALAYAHGLCDEEGRPLRVIHRDVSPSNVMIGYDGSVKLLDFGVAKALSQSDDLTRTGALKGKVGYMSPEGIESEVEPDGRADLFAAGVILHELLTGKRLFKGHDDLRTIALVRACKVAPPSAERADVPPELDRIVVKVLARDREQRYQTANELAADLTKVLHELDWDAVGTEAFLKERGIQPVRESDSQPAAAGADERARPGAELTKGTVVERPPRAGSTARITRRRRRVPRPLVALVERRWLAVGVGTLLLTTLLGWQVSRLALEPAREAAAGALPSAGVHAAGAGAEAARRATDPERAAVADPAVGPAVSVGAGSKAEVGESMAQAPPKAKLRRKSARAGRSGRHAAMERAGTIDLKRGDLLRTF